MIKMNQDQVNNAIHTIAKIAGTALIASAPNKTDVSDWRVAIGGVLLAWSLKASHTQNAQ